MKELLHHMSYSGSDINVYVMVSPESLFSKQKELANSGDLLINDPAFLGGIPDPFLEELRSEVKGQIASEIKADNFNELLKFNSSFIKLAELQTISYSIYREKEQVKALGQATPKGFTRGYVTIAGTMIFTMFYEAVMAQLFRESFIDDLFNGTRIDQLPPLDLFITFTNEQGYLSKMGIFGAEFMNEGQVMSIQDLITENSVNYVARHITRVEAVNSPNKINQELYQLMLNNPARLSLAPGEIRKAAEEIKAEKRFFL